MTQQHLPAHIQQTLQEFDRRLAEIESERQDLLTGRAAVLRLAQEHADPSTGRFTGIPLDQSMTEVLQDCPLSVQEMAVLRDRHRIIRAIAENDPQGRVHVGRAAAWLHAAGIVTTIPVNMAKALSRRMRNDEQTWDYLGKGWFALKEHEREEEHPSEGGAGVNEEE